MFVNKLVRTIIYHCKTNIQWKIARKNVGCKFSGSASIPGVSDSNLIGVCSSGCLLIYWLLLEIYWNNCGKLK